MTTPLLLVDAQCLQGKDPERGIPRWVSNFVSSLGVVGVDCIGLTNPELQPLPTRFGECFSEVLPNSRQAVREVIDGRDVAYLVSSPLEPVRPVRALLPDHIVDSGIPVATIVFDLALYLFPELYQTRDGDKETYRARQRLFACSDALWAISENSRRDVVDVWGVPPWRAHYVGTGIDGFFLRENGRIEHGSSQDRPFIFTVGRSDPRKQTMFTIDVFARLDEEKRRDLDLVIACRLDAKTENLWRNHAQSLGIPDRNLILTGLIDDEELRQLYRTCSVFIEPSLYEGFGLPAGEAAVSGAVVITSNTSSLPEILELPEATFDPHDVGDAARLLRRALLDDDFRRRNREAGARVRTKHDWNLVAQRARELLAKVARGVTVPYANRDTYMRRGIPAGALGRTIPSSCIDD